jgi:hypothetical protein
MIVQVAITDALILFLLVYGAVFSSKEGEKMIKKCLIVLMCSGISLGSMQGCGGDFLGLEDYQRDLVGLVWPFVLDVLGIGNPEPGVGPQGPEGPVGRAGRPGRPGDDGSPGSTWHQGQGDPDGALGIVGDFYINTETNDYYYKEESGWVKLGNLQGDNGQDGVNGANGQNGTDGQDGTNGTDGENGVSCWDLNGNGLPDCFSECCYGERQVSRFVATTHLLNEDVNCDGVVDVYDCQGKDGEQGPPGPLVFDEFIDDFFTTPDGSISSLELGNKVSVLEPSIGECDSAVDVVGYRFGILQMYETDNLITMRLFIWRTGPNNGACFTARLDVFGARHGGGVNHLGTRFVTLDNPLFADPDGTLIVVDLPLNNAGNDPSKGLCLPPNMRPGDLLGFVLTETEDRKSGGCYTLVGAEFYESIGLLGGNGVVHATVSKTEEDIVCDVFTDCDLNGRHDPSEIAHNPDLDCNTNVVLDICEELEDCNETGTPDVCEEFDDCNENGVPDECEACDDTFDEIALCHFSVGKVENERNSRSSASPSTRTRFCWALRRKSPN